SSQLPDYMVPNQFMVLAQLPLTANGKVDKRALPVPEQHTHSYRAAYTATEKQLQEIWAELLKRPLAELSCDANFFALGGDSILSIQLVSRAAEQGLYFSVKDLFQHQTIMTLATQVKYSKTHTVVQDEVTSEMALLPIHHAFFSDETALEHFNQSVLLETPELFDDTCLAPIVTALLTRHDALRLRFTKVDTQWRGQHQRVAEVDAAKCTSIQAWDGEADSLTAAAEQVQRSLSPSTGELLRFVYFHHGQGKGRLLLVIHHLVVDGVSWRILLADIARLYQQYQGGERLQLAQKTNSYQQWSEYLHAYSVSDELQAQMAHWVNSSESHSWLAHYGQLDGQASGHRQQVQLALSEAQTQALLSKVPHSYRTQVNEILLAGLWLAHQRSSGAESLSVTLEGHGRESLDGTIDLSQTVGWFTSLYPLHLRCTHSAEVGAVVMAVKEQYRQVPSAGIGYGVLKYLTGEPMLAKVKTPALQFNYLGQFDQSVSEAGAFAVAQESSGQHISAARIDSDELVLNGKVVFGSLNFTLNYDSGRYSTERLTQLMQAYEQALKDIIVHCEHRGEGPYTPSDFALAQVTTETLLRWQENKDIADLYPATGMQQGLLFHSLLEAGSYVTQTRISFKQLDVASFKAAWAEVVRRHHIFRTAFVGIEEGNAHQLVAKAAVLPWHEEDLSQLLAEEQERYLETFQCADKRQGFESHVAPLMRCSLFKLGEEHSLIWSYHHALLDGWCIPLVFKEINECYSAIMTQQAMLEEPQHSYRDYAQWLSEQDNKATELYWQTVLENVTSHTQLPPNEGVACDVGVEHRIEFSEDETAALQQLAARAHTTLNIVVQTAWGLLLQRYGNQESVVFGSVTSGRPAGLAGVESILGLFINTVPVVLEGMPAGDVTTLLGAQHAQQVARESHSYYPLYEIQKQGSLGEQLFNSVFVFENYPVDEQLSHEGAQGGLVVTAADTTEGTNYELAVVAHVSEGLSIRLEGGAGKYNAPSLARIGG
ncbi:condensation domain-containing protein, partial [Pseudoalteromonas sp. MMG005]|uniref:condensation domain-containing protein n=1 Tax=Pseudoalteromonas sp. MMG005 TaxID=2822682 RepID=UPI001B7B7A3E